MYVIPTLSTLHAPPPVFCSHFDICPFLGIQLHDYYVYNTVQCLHYLADRCLLVAGLDGGKLNIYRLMDSEKLDLLISYSVDTDRVTCLAVSISVIIQ